VYELHIVCNMNINSLVPNDAYAALQDSGFSSLMTQHMHCATVAILKNSVFFFLVGGEMDENTKFCNLNPGFCRLPQ
jgi:hypothetical protein